MTNENKPGRDSKNCDAIHCNQRNVIHIERQAMKYNLTKSNKWLFWFEELPHGDPKSAYPRSSEIPGLIESYCTSNHACNRDKAVSNWTITNNVRQVKHAMNIWNILLKIFDVGDKIMSATFWLSLFYILLTVLGSIEPSGRLETQALTYGVYVFLIRQSKISTFRSLLEFIWSELEFTVSRCRYRCVTIIK